MEHRYANQLIHENSPYLLQHAHNPVNWYPWGDEALTKAKIENKMIIISIGYSSCHWCHVMKRECFEDASVAELMNKNFVCIKVDREERPDIDQIYMNASYLIHGSGGWPLNALALPDGKPFFAGTYFTKDQWISILNYFIEVYQNTPEKLRMQAENLTNHICLIENIPLASEPKQCTIAEMNRIFDHMKKGIDFDKGGIKGSPKFPMPQVWEFLMYYYYVSNNNEALRAVNVTLQNMAFGGIYDHLGGGFARYSTDADWRVPHFEKMLYDNAQLVSLYCKAYQLTQNILCKNVVYETLAFIRNEMTSPENGFYSAFDAESDGEEGKFYVWSKREIENALGNYAPILLRYYNITEAGNWHDGKNILFRTLHDWQIASEFNITPEQLESILNHHKTILRTIRSQRIPPSLDDKIITSWNALMLIAYVNAYRAFGERDFLLAALANAEFITKNCISQSNNIYRIYRNGKVSVNGFLDDYAFTIASFIQLYQVTFDEKWLNKAKELTDYTLEHFYDPKSGMFYYSHNEYSRLISRKMEITDNVIPSSNSEMCKNLFLLGHFFTDSTYLSKSLQMIGNVQEDAHKNMFFYANWGIVEMNFISNFYEIAIVGPDCFSKREELDKYYLPNVIVLGSKNGSRLGLLQDRFINGQTNIYICSHGTCQLPVQQTDEVLKIVKT